MADLNNHDLQSLIRLIAPAHSLREDLEESMTLERYHGTGDMALKTFRGLQASVARIVDDPYVKSMEIDVPEGANDKEKVALVRLTVGQLLSYLEGQTGIPGSSRNAGGRDHSNKEYHMAPSVSFNLVNVKGISEETINRLTELSEQTLHRKDGDQETESE